MPFCVYFQGVHGLLISLMNSLFSVIICIVQIIVSPFHYLFNTVILPDLSFVIVLFFQQVFLDHLLYVSFCGRFLRIHCSLPLELCSQRWTWKQSSGSARWKRQAESAVGVQRGLDHQNFSVKPWSVLYFLIGKRHIVNCPKVFFVFCFFEF